MRKILFILAIFFGLNGHSQQFLMMLKQNTATTDSIHKDGVAYSAQGGATDVHTNETTSDPPSGNIISYFDNGDWIEYTVAPAYTGTYRIKARVATPNSGATISVQGPSGSPTYGTITVPNTGDWTIWQTAYVDVSLTAGSQTIRIFLNTASINLHWLEFVKQ